MHGSDSSSNYAVPQLTCALRDGDTSADTTDTSNINKFDVNHEHP